MGKSGNPPRTFRPTLQDRLALANGRPSGFGLLRLGLAVAVVAWHTVVVGYGVAVQDAVWAGPWRPLPAMILPMFFGLSGFLIAGSLDRSRSVAGFLYLRAIRILPALSVAVVLSAVVVGGALTSLPLADYFGSDGFWRYFRTLAFDIQYNLPGVFPHNPQPNVVNGQLWTVPYEVEGYLALAAAACAGLHRRRGWFLAAVALVQFAFVARWLAGSPVTDASVPGRVLVLCMLAGAALHMFRDRVPFSHGAALAAAAACLGLLMLPGGGYVIALPASYLTVYVGLLDPRWRWVTQAGDYSYGIFLYGYPVQQAAVALSPTLAMPAVNFVVTAPVILALAVLSWHALEERALRLRRYTGAVDAEWAAVAGMRPGLAWLRRYRPVQARSSPAPFAFNHWLAASRWGDSSATSAQNARPWFM